MDEKQKQVKPKVPRMDEFDGINDFLKACSKYWELIEQ